MSTLGSTSPSTPIKCDYDKPASSDSVTIKKASDLLGATFAKEKNSSIRNKEVKSTLLNLSDSSLWSHLVVTLWTTKTLAIPKYITRDEVILNNLPVRMRMVVPASITRDR